MSATVVRERNQTTLPADVLAAAGVRVKDQVDWTFEDGKIVGRKLKPDADVEIETLDMKDVDARTFMPRKMGKVSNKSIREAVWVGRERR